MELSIHGEKKKRKEKKKTTLADCMPLKLLAKGGSNLYANWDELDASVNNKSSMSNYAGSQYRNANMVSDMASSNCFQ